MILYIMLTLLVALVSKDSNGSLDQHQYDKIIPWTLQHMYNQDYMRRNLNIDFLASGHHRLR